MPWLQLFVQNTLQRLDRDEGEVTIEYGVLVVFVALALIAAVGLIVGGIETWFQRIADFIGGRPGSG